ncbi:MAG: VanW family protein [Oscillospiraceae bacterium]|nr:VanW family protein [Oscillospiraceae bacterium]
MQGKHTAGKRVAQAEYNDGLGFFGKAALVILITIIVLAVGGAAGLGVYANHFYEGVFPGVTIADIPLQGLSLTAAQNTLEKQLGAQLENTTVTVSACGEILGSFNQRELGAKAHAAEAALNAYHVGREEGASGWISNALTMAKGLLGDRIDLSATLSYDESALCDAVDQMADRFFIDCADAFYELAEDGLYATKEVNGRELDRDALTEQLRGAQGAIEANWTEIPGKSLDLQAMANEISSEALPARYDIELGAVVEGQVGVQVDVEAAQYVMDAAAEGERIQLPAEVVYPKMTAAELEAVLFRDKLSTFTTYVSGTSVRRGNVKLSGEFVNGTILNHGDVFDYNEIVGERTEERGFGKAAAYRNGETVQEVGGGICQTSSTIYCAVLLANLEIVQRANHRFYPGYVELGMDATVSWGGPEFRFRNDTGYPIRLEVIYQNNNNLTVNIYGTKTDDTYVVMTHEVISTTPYNTIYQETMDLPWGTQSTKQSPYTGYKAATYRNVYDGNGNLISSELEAKSTYQSRDEIILVGINGRPADTGSTETGGTTDTGTTDTGTTDTDGGDTGGENTGGNENTGSGETGGDEPIIPDGSQDGSEEDSGIIAPEDEMPEWLRT